MREKYGERHATDGQKDSIGEKWIQKAGLSVRAAEEAPRVAGRVERALHRTKQYFVGARERATILPVAGQQVHQEAEASEEEPAGGEDALNICQTLTVRVASLLVVTEGDYLVGDFVVIDDEKAEQDANVVRRHVVQRAQMQLRVHRDQLSAKQASQ